MAYVRVFLFVAAAGLWLSGLRLFLRAHLSRRRKVLWSGFLLCVGIVIGCLLPQAAILEKFLIIFCSIPVLAAIDILLVKSRRGFLFWIRACGFEICSVFYVAVAVRWFGDLAGLSPLAAG